MQVTIGEFRASVVPFALSSQDKNKNFYLLCSMVIELPCNIKFLFYSLSNVSCIDITRAKNIGCKQRLTHTTKYLHAPKL